MKKNMVAACACICVEVICMENESSCRVISSETMKPNCFWNVQCHSVADIPADSVIHQISKCVDDNWIIPYSNTSFYIQEIRDLLIESMNLLGENFLFDFYESMTQYFKGTLVGVIREQRAKYDMMIYSTNSKVCDVSIFSEQDSDRREAISRGIARLLTNVLRKKYYLNIYSLPDLPCCVHESWLQNPSFCLFGAYIGFKDWIAAFNNDYVKMALLPAEKRRIENTVFLKNATIRSESYEGASSPAMSKYSVHFYALDDGRSKQLAKISLRLDEILSNYDNPCEKALKNSPEWAYYKLVNTIAKML